MSRCQSRAEEDVLTAEQNQYTRDDAEHSQAGGYR